MNKLINTFTHNRRIYTLEKDKHEIYRIKINGTLFKSFLYQKLALMQFEKLKQVHNN